MEGMMLINAHPQKSKTALHIPGSQAPKAPITTEKEGKITGTT